MPASSPPCPPASAELSGNRAAPFVYDGAINGNVAIMDNLPMKITLSSVKVRLTKLGLGSGLSRALPESRLLVEGAIPPPESCKPRGVRLCRGFTQICISSQPCLDVETTNSSMDSQPLIGSASNANLDQSAMKLNSRALECLTRIHAR